MPLFLLRFGVPFWTLAFVFGHNPMCRAAGRWYRMYLCLGQSSVTGTMTLTNCPKTCSLMSIIFAFGEKKLM